MEYVGSELELFQHARNWKAYFAAAIGSLEGLRVLEVGAGMGATTEVLCTGGEAEWWCLEPDSSLAGQIDAKREAGVLPSCCRVLVGTLENLRPDHLFDCAVYVDVLEHIEDDRAELARAAAALGEGGRLVVVAPAHQSLFSAFDTAIGHHRRYSAPTLTARSPGGLEVERIWYLDSVGLLASLANRLLLRRSLPTQKQILLWDRWMVPLSRRLDGVLGHRLGKSVLAVWRRPAGVRWASQD